jgi:hypothetical protein
MMKKTLAISSKTLVLDSQFSVQLQGHCFGFSLYCLLRLQHPEHPILALSQNASCGVRTRPFDYAQGPYGVPERSRRIGSRSLPDTFCDSDILTGDVVADSQSLQTRYDENKNNDGAIIVLPGLIERQGAVFSVGIQKRDTLWDLAAFPEGLLDRGPCVFYFAVVGGDEGHTLYLDPGDPTRDAVICDTHDPSLQTTIPAHAVQDVMAQKITDYFLSRHAKDISGQIWLQTICYEKTIG